MPREDLADLRRKPKLGYDELIEYMRAKGVRFDLCSEDEARRFISEDTYYARTTAFADLFERLPDGSFADLDFAAIRDLYGIDLALRRVTLEATLDIEHFLKVRLMDMVTMREEEDGYGIVDDFWASLSKSQRNALKNDLDIHADRHTVESSPWLSSEYRAELLARYELDMPLWVFLQLAFFSTTVSMNAFCGRRWGVRAMMDEEALLHDVKSLRNLCAHGNPVLDALARVDSHEPHARVLGALVAAGVDEGLAREQLRCRRVRELCSLFWCYGEMGHEGTRHCDAMLDDIDALWARAGRNPQLYEDADLVRGRLGFLRGACDALLAGPLGR